MDGTDPPVDDPAPHPADLIRDPAPQPLLSWRRLAIAGLLAVAVGCLVVAAQAGRDTPDSGYDQAVVRYVPEPGGRVLRQSEIGVELAPGYDGRLTVNGVPIPEEQMEGAVVPGTEAWSELTPEQQREQGPRPNNKNRVLYRPGAGKAVASFPTGEVQVGVRFWKVVEGPGAARTLTYTVYVT